MKILHTADWHLGKRLHKQDLTEDHKLFFDWLINYIETKHIDLLLVSGDIFDSANPSNEARQLYYGFLAKMVKFHCRIVITGGNHDAPSMLNAPRDLLEMLDISVIGGMVADISQMLVPFPKQNPQIIIAAVPYLHDAYLRQVIDKESASEKLEAVRLGLKKFYETVIEIAKEQYPQIPVLGMGHLYAQGAITSESEREIQVGNLAAFGADEFPSDFIYMALGHIHKPQMVGKNEKIRYSGSPIPLSFSEKSDAKVIVELDFADNQIVTIDLVPIPQFRVLKRISGNFDDVKKQLIDYKNDAPLKAFLEVEVEEENHNAALNRELNDIIAVFDNEDAEILKQKITFKNQVSGSDELFELNQNIDEISEKEMLIKRLDYEAGLSEEHRTMILEAFEELLQQVQQEL